MLEMSTKNQAVSRPQTKDLALDLVLQLPAQTENEFVPGMCHRTCPTVGTVFER